jgi:hypothetical protein
MRFDAPQPMRFAHPRPPTEDGLVPPDEGAALVRQFLFPFFEVSANTAQNHRPCGCRSFDLAEESSSTAAQTGAEEEVENVWFWSVWSSKW